MVKTVECVKCLDDNAGIPENLRCSKCRAEYFYDKKTDTYFVKRLKCLQCKKESSEMTSRLKCEHCGTEYVYDAKEQGFRRKTIKCGKCGEMSSTITEHGVCDKCGAEYAVDTLGVSIFMRKTALYPMNSLRYIFGGAYYSGFWAKIAGVFFGLLLGLAFIIDNMDFAWVGWLCLLFAAACAFLLVKGYRKAGLRGFFGLKASKLSKKALEIQKRALEAKKQGETIK